MRLVFAFAAAWAAVASVTATPGQRPAPQAPVPAVQFSNGTAAAGIDFVHTNGASAEKYLVETMGSGAALLDIDDDGFLDLFLVDGGVATGRGSARHRLYRNLQRGRFEDVTAKSGIGHSGYGMGACAGDVDNDGRVDLYVTNYAANTLYRNTGGGVFADITRAAGVGLAVWSTSCAFVDVDRDGDLDLFVANYLDVPRDRSQFCGDPQRRIRVYCHPLNHAGLASVLYRNDGKGVFTDASGDAGIAGHVGNGLGVAVGGK
jgi:enediyne biosynthesis protein E4